MEESKKVWDKEMIQQLLATNDKAATKALMTIYSKQTQSEQAVGTTTDQNSVGFTAFDAEILTSFAQQYERSGFLTAAQIALLKKRITKYWRQLLDAAKSKGAEVSYKLPKKAAQ